VDLLHRLDETRSSTLGVNLLEALELLALLDDTHVCEEETDNNGHEPINRAEDVVQGFVGGFGDRRHTESVEGLCGTLASADTPTDRELIGRAEIATAFQSILNQNLGCIAFAAKDSMVVVPFMECVNPEKGADDEDQGPVAKEHPVQEIQTERRRVAGDYGSQREHERGDEDNTQNRAKVEVRR